jgi:exosortase
VTQAGATTPSSPNAGLWGRAARVVDAVRVDPAASAVRALPAILAAIAFAVLFAQPMYLLVRDWWTLPEAGHGLLLAPVAVWLAWKSGIRRDAVGNVTLGIAMLLLAIVIRYLAGLAAELFSMRASIVLALGGLTVYHYGFRQLLRWWLPFLLACLAIPLPELVTQALAMPLQFRASEMGASLLRWREVPVFVTGNVIRIPGHELFVTEACSGLRSLTALLSLAVLMGGLMLKHPVARILLVALAIPIAIVINGVRVFLTGFLVFFVDPKLGKGFMHVTEGWLLFIVSFTCIAGLAWIAAASERWWDARREVVHA